MKRPEVEIAEEALRALGKEDLIFSHHGEVMARPGAYARLGEFFKRFAEDYHRAAVGKK